MHLLGFQVRPDPLQERTRQHQNHPRGKHRARKQKGDQPQDHHRAREISQLRQTHRRYRPQVQLIITTIYSNLL